MDLYQSITDRILEAMETIKAIGTKLWDGAGERVGLPINYASGKHSSAINVLIL